MLFIMATANRPFVFDSPTSGSKIEQECARTHCARKPSAHSRTQPFLTCGQPAHVHTSDLDIVPCLATRPLQTPTCPDKQTSLNTGYLTLETHTHTHTHTHTPVLALTNVSVGGLCYISLSTLADNRRSCTGHAGTIQASSQLVERMYAPFILSCGQFPAAGARSTDKHLRNQLLLSSCAGSW
jgi:hypothetical protein